MSEPKNQPVKRSTVDEMTKRIVDHGKANGREIRVDDAKKIATDSAQRVNRSRER